MKEKLKKILSVLLLCVMVILLNVTAPLADRRSGTIRVPTGGVMVKAESGVIRTGEYSYARAVAKSVYPTGSYTTDNFTKCKTSLYKNGSATTISKTYTLTEGTAKRLYINEGYLGQKKLDLYFSGNNDNLPAYIAYSFNGL